MPAREREHLVQERVRLENRIEALLATQGIRQRPSLRSWSATSPRSVPVTGRCPRISGQNSAACGAGWCWRSR